MHLYTRIKFYYLSNVLKNEPGSQILFMSREEMEQEYINNPDLLMIVFCEKGNEIFLPVGFINNSRIKIIIVSPE